MTCPRLDANTRAAITAASATVIPKMAERTGTAVRSRPGSNARRVPATAVGGKPAPVIHHAICEPRRVVLAADMLAGMFITRGAVIAARPARSSVRRAAPPSRIAALKDKPGETSARRASPIGVNAESP